MSHFLEEIFRPNTPQEQDAIARHTLRRAIIRLGTLAVIVVILGIVALSKTMTYAPYRGTWVLVEDHADGFHKSDQYLEIKSAEVWRSGKRIGSMRYSSDKPYLTAPNRNYSWYLSVDGETLTVEYTIPASTAVYMSFPGQLYTPPSPMPDHHQVDTYVRISTEYDLTQEERDELY